MKINVDSIARRVEVDNRIPLRHYYRIADNLLKQASIYREEKNVVDLYIILLRYSSLVSETIPFHRDYQVLLPKERMNYKKRLLAVLDELESLKPKFQRRVDELNEGHSGVGLPQLDGLELNSFGSEIYSWEWPAINKNSYSSVDNRQAVQASFRAEEMANSYHRQMKEEEGRRNAVVEAFQVAERSLQEMKKKLQEEESERKYIVAALENAEKQVKSQRLQLWGVEDQLATSKTQIAALKKKLEDVEKARVSVEKAKEEAEKAKDEAEQNGYEVGVAETEDTLRAEVPAVCRTYCALTWGEALNQAGVEASSVLRKAENIYYPPAIRLSSSSDSKADSVSSEIGGAQGDPLKPPLATDTTTTRLKQAEDISKTGEANRETVQGFDLPPPASKDTSKEKEDSQSVELVSATLTIPSKEDPKDMVEESTTTASTQPPKDPKDKLMIKMKK